MTTVYYFFSRDTAWDRRLQKQINVYCIDRRPVGPAYNLADEISADMCQPCGSPRRWALLLPEEVAAEYPSDLRYVSSETLPGFLSWAVQNSYSIIDYSFVFPVAHGFWLKYTGNPAARALPAATRTVMSGHTGSQSVYAPRPRAAIPRIKRAVVVKGKKPPVVKGKKPSVSKVLPTAVQKKKKK
jgi:hypothetical protein